MQILICESQKPCHYQIAYVNIEIRIEFENHLFSKKKATVSGGKVLKHSFLCRALPLTPRSRSEQSRNLSIFCFTPIKITFLTDNIENFFSSEEAYLLNIYIFNVDFVGIRSVWQGYLLIKKFSPLKSNFLTNENLERVEECIETFFYIRFVLLSQIELQ